MGGIKEIKRRLIALEKGAYPKTLLSVPKRGEWKELTQLVNQLTIKIKKEERKKKADIKRLNQIQLILFRFLARDFSKQANISGDQQEIDALALSVNYFGEELKNSYELIERQSKELQQKNDNLMMSLEERTTLLKELHHRVKNNLQVITSLLSLQAGAIENEELRTVFRYSQYRINAMALIHEMLYQNEALSRVYINDYLQKITTNLLYSIKGTAANIKIKLEIPPIHLNMDTSIPLGLLMNELITNALKHGIKDSNKGSLHIEMEKLNNITYQVKIGDDGVGYAEQELVKKQGGLGLMLISRLVMQLKGDIKKTNSPGTNYVLTFREIGK